jgi:hypothetical protein
MLLLSRLGQQFTNEEDVPNVNITYFNHHLIRDPGSSVFDSLRFIRSTKTINVEGQLTHESKRHIRETMQQEYIWSHDFWQNASSISAER